MSTTPQPTGYIIPPPEGPNWRTPLAVGAILLLLASNVYLFVQVERIKTDTKASMAKLSSTSPPLLSRFASILRPMFGRLRATLRPCNHNCMRSAPQPNAL